MDVGGGATGRSTIVPVLRGDTLLGYIVGEADAATWLANTLPSAEHSGYAVTVLGAGRTLFELEGGVVAGIEPRIDVPVGDRTAGWQLAVAPLARTARNPVTVRDAMLVVGFAIALLVWGVARLARQAAQRALVLKRTKPRCAAGEIAPSSPAIQRSKGAMPETIVRS